MVDTSDLDSDAYSVKVQALSQVPKFLIITTIICNLSLSGRAVLVKDDGGWFDSSSYANVGRQSMERTS